MSNLLAMITVELRKALRSKVPLWTGLGALFIPLSIAFLIFVAKHPELSQRLGLVSAKANLMAYSATDWHAYCLLLGQIIAAAGFVFSVFVVSWVFGREFTDGTVKDLLAVPIKRSRIVFAKFIVAALWSGVLFAIIFAIGLVMGIILQLPAGTIGLVFQNSFVVAAVACMVMAVTVPFAFFASIGRGYLLPMGVMFLLLMIAQFSGVVGWGEYFPWAIPGIYAQGKVYLGMASYVVVGATGLIGIIATYLWWKYADQGY